MQNTDGFNANLSFIIAIFNMEMRWLMVVVIHADNQTKKAAYFGHNLIITPES